MRHSIASYVWPRDGADIQTDCRAAATSALTLLCLLGCLAIAFAAVRILTSWLVFIDLPPAHVAGALAASGITAPALAGYWMMRRCGLWLMVIAVLVRIASALLDAIPLRPVHLDWPRVIVLLGLVYDRRLH